MKEQGQRGLFRAVAVLAVVLLAGCHSVNEQPVGTFYESPVWQIQTISDVAILYREAGECDPSLIEWDERVPLETRERISEAACDLQSKWDGE